MSWQKYTTALLGVSLGFLMCSSARALKWPPAPTDLGAPSSTFSGAIRGNNCNHDSVPPLLPVVPNEITTFTASARPTLYIYIPPIDATIAQIGIIDVRAQQLVGEPEEITISASPGILPVSLPKGVSLEPGRLYNWVFSVYCNPQNRERQETVEGNLLRVEENTIGENLPDTPLERAQWYLENRLWYETVAELAALRSRHPSEWQELLKSVGLTDIHAKPLLGSQPVAPERNVWWLPNENTSHSAVVPESSTRTRPSEIGNNDFTNATE